MHISRTLVAAAVASLAVPFAAAAAAPAAVAARAIGAGGTWGTAAQVPGTAALNQGDFAVVTSVSCASAGNCSAGGFYLDGSGNQQAFVVTQTNGAWGTAEEVPGTAALNTILAGVTSVSCASAGNCGAGGFYVDGSGNQQAFVVTQTNGAWGTAEEVPGTAALNTGGLAQVDSVTCAAPGNCSAGGYYNQSHTSTIQQAFVVSQANGTWGTAEEVPGTAALNQGQLASLVSVSCASPGNCSAVGNYTTSSHTDRAFAVRRANGTWGTARTIAKGSADLIDSLSCASPGNCSAGGSYAGTSAGRQALVVSETSGTWGTAEKVPGTAALNAGANATVLSVSCASAGNCGAVGDYTDGAGHQQAFAVAQANGTWGTAKEVPGTAALNTGGNAALSSISCASAGNCSAGGSYQSSSGSQALVVSETNGTWGKAEEVPGTAALNVGGDAGVSSVSCGAAGNCGAGGFYKAVAGSNDFQAFIVNQTNPR